jgi:hypothetical protein
MMPLVLAGRTHELSNAEDIECKLGACALPQAVISRESQ